MSQATAAKKSGFPQTVISRTETGARGLDILELLALGLAYGKSVEDVGKLFTPPSAAEWTQVLARRVPDERFAAPPTWNRFAIWPTTDPR